MASFGKRGYRNVVFTVGVLLWGCCCSHTRENGQLTHKNGTVVSKSPELFDLFHVVHVVTVHGSQASLERCLLRFLNDDGNPVEVFMPALTVLASWLMMQNVSDTNLFMIRSNTSLPTYVEFKTTTSFRVIMSH